MRRALTFLVVIATAAVLAQLARNAPAPSDARAQIGGIPPPPPAPLAPPPAAQPEVPLSALPRLAPAPGTTPITGLTPVATPRVFRCSCSGPGVGTQWVGVVTAPNYSQASRSATSACIAFSLNANAQSPLIPTPSFGFRGSQQPQTGVGAPQNLGAARQPSAIAPSQMQANQLLVASACSKCACN
jgi:hypothetical protein